MTLSSFSLHSLPKVSARGKKRVGRGYGSGKGGHTSGRGQKGQKSRRTIPWSFEGGALSLSHRLPFWRGKGRLNPLKPKPAIVNIGDLDRLKEGTVVDMAFLVKEGFLTEKEARVQSVKILGRGKLTKKLTISGLAVSMPAKAKIEKAGGKIEGLRVKGPNFAKASMGKQGIKEEGTQVKEMVRMAEKSEEKKPAEQKTVEKPTKSIKKVVKKPAVKTSRKIAQKTTPNKKPTKKTSK